MLIIFISTVCMISACGSKQAWYWHKHGSTQQDFYKDKYVCMQEAQQRQSYAKGGYCTGYYCQPGYADSSVVTNWPLFDTCMKARGWEFREESQIRALEEKSQARVTEEKRNMDYLINDPKLSEGARKALKALEAAREKKDAD